MSVRRADAVGGGAGRGGSRRGRAPRAANLLLGLLLGAAAAHGTAGGAPVLDPERFRAHVAALTREDHRLAGTPEGGRAAAYIESQLRQMPGEVLTQSIRFPQEIVARCELRAGSGSLALQPLAANGLQPCITPPEGLRAPLVYIGAARLSVSDIRDAGALRSRLAAAEGAAAPSPARRLWERLPPELRQPAAPDATADGGDATFRRRLASAMDRLVLGDAGFFDAQAFAGVSLRPETRTLVEQREGGLTAVQTRRLNRLLLEDAFPDMITRGADGKRMDGCIAVDDLGRLDAFGDAFRLGASAIIFIGQARDNFGAPPWSAGRLPFSADLPRFLVTEEQALASDLLGEEQAELHSRVTWEPCAGTNVFLWIPGRAPSFGPNAGEYVILSAPFDSGGIAPRRCPDRERAANCAALIETARMLAAQPPARSVLVAFFDNHANFLQGGREFYGALRRAIGQRADYSFEDWETSIRDERDALVGIHALYGRDDLIGGQAGRTTDALQRLADEARTRYNAVMTELQDARVAHRKLAAAAASAGRDGRERELQARIEQLGREQRAWQKVRESIRDRKPPDASQDALACDYLRMTIELVRAQIGGRLLELDDDALRLGEQKRLTAPLAGATPVCHAAFRFTAGSSRWLFLPHGLTQHMRLYAAWMDRVGAEGAAAAGFAWDTRTSWEAANATPLSHVAWQTVEECALAEIFNIPAVALVTEMDRTAAQGWPDDAATGDPDAIRGQAQGFLAFLMPLLDEAWVSVPNRILAQRKFLIEEPAWNGRRPEGHAVKIFGFGDTEASTPAPNALVRVMDGSMRAGYVVMANGNGHFPLAPVFNTIEAPTPAPGASWRYLQLEAASFGADGRIERINACVPGGGTASVDTGWHRAGRWRAKAETGYNTILTLFQGTPGFFLGRENPFAGGFKTYSFRLLGGLGNTDIGESQKLCMRYDNGIGVCWVERPAGIKIVYKDPRNPDSVLLYVNATPDNPLGTGYGPGVHEEDTAPLQLDLHQAMAADMLEVNESRLDRLRRKSIVLNYMEYLHSRARRLREALVAAQAGHLHSLADLHAAVIAAFERNVYRPVMATTDDMVKSVTVLLLLAMLFAVAAQSLLLPTYNVYRRIGCVAGIFVLVFAALYVSHPAFAFSATPAVIILAFIIMVMSGAVIWVVSDRFRYEIKKLRGLASETHAIENRVLGNFGAAFSLAISAMRRRSARTGLTVVTVLLLTFTILTFVASQAEFGVQTFRKGPAADSVSSLMLRGAGWRDFPGGPEPWRDFLETYHGGTYALHGRYWLTRPITTDINADEDLYVPVRTAAGDKHAVAGSIMTLDRQELERVPGIAAVLPPEHREDFARGEGVYLSQALADQLGVAPGAPIVLSGLPLRFLGVFDAAALLKQQQIDGSPLAPVSFVGTRMAFGEAKAKGSAVGGSDALADMEEALERLEPEALVPVTPDALVIAPTALAGPLRLALKALVMYPDGNGDDLEPLARDLAILHHDGVFVNQGGERTHYRYGDRRGALGSADVVIPLLLGGLIVFSTMLGSVVDREKEIYTFSALGLAPRSIAMLFFVEAAVYAVLGGLGGYFLGQVVMRMLEGVARFVPFQVPEMNYSSSTVVQTILLVIATVLVSTIYPAVKAARKATAETLRQWRAPAPQGNRLVFDFPFTISRYDVTGIACFIQEHFRNHADRTVGAFAADQAGIRLDAQHRLAALSARIWLQPFDQGISQTFNLTARPSADIEEVCEITLHIERLSGPDAAWRRACRVFLTDLRAQFLLWRTLGDEAREHYLAQADAVEARLAEPPPGPHTDRNAET